MWQTLGDHLHPDCQPQAHVLMTSPRSRAGGRFSGLVMRAGLLDTVSGTEDDRVDPALPRRGLLAPSLPPGRPTGKGGCQVMGNMYALDTPGCRPAACVRVTKSSVIPGANIWGEGPTPPHRVRHQGTQRTESCLCDPAQPGGKA